jgi:hypothetical protein
MTLAEGIDVPVLIARYERGLRPLKDVEPGGRSLQDPAKVGALSAGLGDDLAMLWTKAAPTASEGQADAWLKIMVVALSDLPGRVAREAAQAALHKPLRFVAEIETVVRECAEAVLSRHRRALRNLRDLETELMRERTAAVPVADEPPPITAAGIRAMTPAMRAIGLGLGAITQDEINAALAERIDQAA